MWNIRSHARRFPVHTGTLTPSIAHPNRFLNHLKLFSAGFLTFRGGKIKNCTVSGDKTNDFECAPGSWLVLSVKPCRACQLSQRESPWHDGKVSGQTITLSGFARGSLFEGAVAQRLRGFQSAEHKKSFSEATWIFCMEPNSFGVTRGEQPLVCNGDDRGQWPKQGGAVGAAACRMRVPRKARSRRREPQPAASRASKVAGAFLVLFWHAKENVPGGNALAKGMKL